VRLLRPLLRLVKRGTCLGKIARPHPSQLRQIAQRIDKEGSHGDGPRKSLFRFIKPQKSLQGACMDQMGFGRVPAGGKSTTGGLFSLREQRQIAGRSCEIVLRDSAPRPLGGIATVPFQRFVQPAGRFQRARHGWKVALCFLLL